MLCDEVVNGRPAFVRQDKPLDWETESLLWWAEGRWWVGKKAARPPAHLPLVGLASS